MCRNPHNLKIFSDDPPKSCNECPFYGTNLDLGPFCKVTESSPSFEEDPQKCPIIKVDDILSVHESTIKYCPCCGNILYL